MIKNPPPAVGRIALSMKCSSLVFMLVFCLLEGFAHLKLTLKPLMTKFLCKAVAAASAADLDAKCTKPQFCLATSLMEMISP